MDITSSSALFSRCTVRSLVEPVARIEEIQRVQFVLF